MEAILFLALGLLTLFIGLRAVDKLGAQRGRQAARILGVAALVGAILSPMVSLYYGECDEPAPFAFLVLPALVGLVLGIVGGRSGLPRLGRIVCFLVLWGACLGRVLGQLSSCVVAGALISTPSGPRHIESLREGDQVWTQGPSGVEPGFVVGTVPSLAVAHLELELADGTSLRVTGAHPVAVASGWSRASDIEPGQWVRLFDGRTVVSHVRRVVGAVTVYDLSIAPNPNFFAEGVLVHNKRPNTQPSAALGDVRMLISAQAGYEGQFGYFESRLECLVKPADCQPDYRADWPTFLEEKFLRSERNGYRFEFFAGPPVRPDPEPRLVSRSFPPSAITSFAYVANPIRQKPARCASKLPAFCGDSRVVCVKRDGSSPSVEGGLCVVKDETHPDGCVLPGP